MATKSVIGLVIAVLFLQPARPQITPTTTVSGHVVNRVTGEGISGVDVTLTWVRQITNTNSIAVMMRMADSRRQYHATTGTAGAFHITDVDQGTYVSAAKAPGFVLESNTGVLAANRADSGGVSIEMIPLVSIRGRVVDPDGKPPANFIAEVSSSNSVRVSAKGEFEITDLLPGSYTLLARPALTYSEKKTVPINGEERREIVPTFFPGVTYRSQAVPILVSGVSDLSGFEIKLQTAPVHRVRGVVLDEAGDPVKSAVVQLRSLVPQAPGRVSGTFNPDGPGYFAMPTAEPGIGPDEDSVLTEDGAFEFSSVQAGEWRLVAEADPEPLLTGTARSVRVTADALTVGRRDVEGIQLRLAAPFAFHVLVEGTDSKASASPSSVRVELTSVEGLPTPKSVGEVDGQFLIENVRPGKYRILAPPSFNSDSYVASIMIGGRQVIRQTVDLTRDSPAARILYKPNGGSVRGTVEKCEGAQVFLVPQTSSVVDFGRSAPCEPDGTFEIRGLAPGNYSVAAFTRSAFLGSTGPMSLGSGAATVRVEEGSSTSVNLRVIPRPN